MTQSLQNQRSVKTKQQEDKVIIFGFFLHWFQQPNLMISATKENCNRQEECLFKRESFIYKKKLWTFAQSSKIIEGHYLKINTEEPFRKTPEVVAGFE